jgi:hypothetical protein
MVSRAAASSSEGHILGGGTLLQGSPAFSLHRNPSPRWGERLESPCFSRFLMIPVLVVCGDHRLAVVARQASAAPTAPRAKPIVGSPRGVYPRCFPVGLIFCDIRRLRAGCQDDYGPTKPSEKLDIEVVAYPPLLSRVSNDLQVARSGSALGCRELALRLQPRWKYARVAATKGLATARGRSVPYSKTLRRAPNCWRTSRVHTRVLGVP